MTPVDAASRPTDGMERWLRGERPAVTSLVVDAPAAGPSRQGWWARVDWQRARHNGVLVVPLLLVNGFAMYGQAEWAREQLEVPVVVAWLFAVALESIALFLAAEAHSALMAGDAAVARRVGSYLVAGVVGWLNWTHWASDNVAAGAVFAAFSVLSPWLWAVRSRSMRRAELRSAGLVDARLVRFAASRWALYPVRTFRVWRHAAWAGITDPAVALAEHRSLPAPATTQPASAARRQIDGDRLAVATASPQPAARPARTRTGRASQVGVTSSPRDLAKADAIAWRRQHGVLPTPAQLQQAKGHAYRTAHRAIAALSDEEAAA